MYHTDIIINIQFTFMVLLFCFFVFFGAVYFPSMEQCEHSSKLRFVFTENNKPYGLGMT